MLSTIAPVSRTGKHERSPLLTNAREALRSSLLEWYDRAGRSLPWRVRPEDRAAGVAPDPYAVWVSEIMLQQTTAQHAAPYWRAFLRRWPTVRDLADAPREEVLAAWAGLGYYARARNLHACAQTVANERGGVFPQSLEDLRALPGVGEYTSNAIRAVAFDKPASVVDGNVERVLTRMTAMQTPLPGARLEIRVLAAELASPVRPGDYAQAIMDLGAVVCTPKSPRCSACPWSAWCAGRRTGHPARFPLRQKKKSRPVRWGVCFHVTGQGRIWLRRRPETGLLGAMMELPGTGWTDSAPDPTEIDKACPFEADWRRAGRVRHVFTHFSLELEVICAAAPEGWRPDVGGWVPLTGIDQAGLPSVMMKAVRLGLETRPV